MNINSLDPPLRPAAAVSAVAAIALAALAMAVPTGASAGTAAPAQAGQTTAPQVPVLRWQACDDGFQCATARVPLDYRHPDAAKISIAVIRHLATDPAQRLGTMFVNLGGPMDQIEPFVSGFTAIPAQLRARYDIVSFDRAGLASAPRSAAFRASPRRTTSCPAYRRSPSAHSRTRRGSEPTRGSTRCAPSAALSARLGVRVFRRNRSRYRGQVRHPGEDPAQASWSLTLRTTCTWSARRPTAPPRWTWHGPSGRTWC